MADIYNCKIISKEKLNTQTFMFRISCKSLAEKISPGQFLHIKCKAEHILRRPICVASVDESDIYFVIEIRGAGTRWLCERPIGFTLDILGPLGNGFTLSAGNIIVVGGGVGVPPLLYAARIASADNKTKCNITAILGFRDKSKIILYNEFSSICSDVIITTDDGSSGIKGFVTEPLRALIKENKIDMVLTCGPRKMMESVAKICSDNKISCRVSLEERMGCGVGACMVCACKTIKNGTEQMSLVCSDGPVFDAQEIVW